MNNNAQAALALMQMRANSGQRSSTSPRAATRVVNAHSPAPRAATRVANAHSPAPRRPAARSAPRVAITAARSAARRGATPRQTPRAGNGRWLFTANQDRALINFLTSNRAFSDRFGRGVAWYQLPANSILRERWEEGGKHLGKRAKRLVALGRLIANRNANGKVVRYRRP